MTDEQTNQLIDLGGLAPHMAATALELDRLTDLTTDPAARNILTQLVRGYLSCAHDPCEPFLTPVPMDNIPQATHHAGAGEVGDVDTIELAGSKTAVWRCTSFMHRMAFLYDGCLAVAYPPGRIPALGLRLDLEALGLKFTPTE